MWDFWTNCLFFAHQKKHWHIIVQAVTRMFCTVIQSCVNDCFFLEKCPEKIAAKTLRCCLAACSLYQEGSAGPLVSKNNRCVGSRSATAAVVTVARQRNGCGGGGSNSFASAVAAWRHQGSMVAATAAVIWKHWWHHGGSGGSGGSGIAAAAAWRRRLWLQAERR